MTCSSVAHRRDAATSARYTALVAPSQPSKMSLAIRMRTTSERAAAAPPVAHVQAVMHRSQFLPAAARHNWYTVHYSTGWGVHNAHKAGRMAPMRVHF